MRVSQITTEEQAKAFLQMLIDNDRALLVVRQLNEGAELVGAIEMVLAEIKAAVIPKGK